MLAERILVRLDDYWLNQIGNVAVATVARPDWQALTFTPDLGGEFGWTWPAEHNDPECPTHTILVGYCPELIAELIAHLADEERSAYLDAVEYLCSRFISENGIDREDNIRPAILAELEDNFPASAKLMADVHERAIREGIVTFGPPAEGSCPTCGWINEPDAVHCQLCDASLS